MARARPEGRRPSALGLASVVFALLGLVAGARSSLAFVPPQSTITHDQWNAVAVDRSGDAVAAGMSLPPWVGREQPPCSFVAAKLAGGSGSVLWRYVEDDCESDETISEIAGEQVFIDPAGDVVIGRYRHLASPAFTIYKLAAATGELLWGRHIGFFHDYGPNVQSTAMDAAGDVVVGGGFHRTRYEPYIHLDPYNTELVVAKLESATGLEVWRRTLTGDFTGDDEDPGFNQVHGVAVDAKGDVVVSGVLFNRRPDSRYPDARWTVLKLRGATGEELWRHDLGKGSPLWMEPIGSRVALDARGDVVVVGGDAIVKLSGACGVERWRREVPRLDARLVTAADDVIVAGVASTGEVEGDILIVRLAGENGGELWRRQVDGSATDEKAAFYRGASDTPYAVVTDASGSVLVVGQLANLGSAGDALVVALEGATGRERWRREIEAGDDGDDALRGVALVDSEHIAVTGMAGNAGTGTDALAAVLSAADGEPRWQRECDGFDRAGDLPESACVVIANAPPDEPTTTSIVTTTTTSTTIQSCLFTSCEDGDPCTSDRCDGVTCRHATATGSDAERCMLAGGVIGVRDCRGGATPARLVRQLMRARRLLERAERAVLPIRRRGLVGSATKQLNRAGRLAVRRGCILTGKPGPGM